MKFQKKSSRFSWLSKASNNSLINIPQFVDTPLYFPQQSPLKNFIHKLITSNLLIQILVSVSRGPLNAQQAWDDHVERMKELERRYPSRYGLYLRDKHAPIVINEDVQEAPRS